MPTIEEQHLMLPLQQSGKYYYLDIPEIEYANRYHVYTEVLIPIYSITNNTSSSVDIRFAYDSIANIEDTEVVDFETYHITTKVRVTITDTNNQISILSSIETCGAANVYEGNSCEISHDIYDRIKINDEFIILSIMINPQLNDPTGTGGSPIVEEHEYSSALFFINGYQLVFDDVELVPLYKFYSIPDNTNHEINLTTPEIVVYIDDDSNSSYEIPYVIWNTDYERFVYKDLAQMCYKEHSKNITTVETNTPRSYLKHPVLDGCFKHISENISANLVAPYSIGSDVIKFSSTTSLNNGFILYKAYKVTKQSYDTLTMQISLIDLIDDNYNVFNDLYASDYSNLGNLESIQEQIVRTAVYNITSNEQYIVFYIRMVNGQPMIGYGSTLDIEMNFGPTQETVQLSSSKYYTLIIHPKSYSSTNQEETEKLVQIEDISYSGNIPYPTDITTEEKNSLSMSPNNYHWKSLWKYNRTIEYSSPLQDNPVILPLNVFTEDENENMFIEFDISSTYEWRINLFDTGQFTGTTDNAAVTENTLFLNNGIEYHKRSTHLYLNIVKDNESVFDSETYPFIQNGISRFMIYYNSTDKKLLLKFGNSDPKEITEITKDVLRNILCHIPGTGSITINFGPTSDYFQDYIDKILDQDTPEEPTQEIQIINKNIVKDLQFYNISDIVGGG